MGTLQRLEKFRTSAGWMKTFKPLSLCILYPIKVIKLGNPGFLVHQLTASRMVLGSNTSCVLFLIPPPPPTLMYTQVMLYCVKG